MNRFIIICLTSLMALTAATSSSAAVWQSVQGEVVKLSYQGSSTSLRLWCFGKQWPLKQDENGNWRGWIGVDLKTRPGSYPVEWSDGKQVVQHDQLSVSKGEFRISRIEVQRKMAEFDAETLARIRREVKQLKATYVAKVDGDPDIIMHGRPSEGIVSTPFGAQRYVNGVARSPHSGIDIAAPTGTPIRTPLAGKVLMVHHMYLNGITVVIGHGNGLVSVFCHMDSAAVKEGDWVTTHTEIGKVGATGRATGPHLHWGVRFNNARVDPATLL